MATKMTKSTVGAKTAGPSKQYLKRGGKVKKSLAKAQDGKITKDTTGMTFPYISPKGAVYMTGSDYQIGQPSNPGSGATAAYLSKQSPDVQKRTGYTAVTSTKKIGGKVMSKKMYGGMKKGGTKKAK